jgi:general secretion pathway protein G
MVSTMDSQALATPPSTPTLRRRRRVRAFTLLELIVVVSIIGILAAIAVPNYLQTPPRAKEAVLKTNLRTLREVIDQHRADKGNYPESLDALVEGGYLRKVPTDPFTGEAEWGIVFEELSEDDVPPETEEGTGGAGIMDVYSLAEGLSLDGKPYAEF